MSNEERSAMFNECLKVCPEMTVECFNRFCDSFIAFKNLNPKQQDFVISYMQDLINKR